MNGVKIMNNSHEEILGFNPKSNKQEIGLIKITPKIAQHILDYLNKDNRPVKKGQVQKIVQSIDTVGWQDNGEAMTFNTDGNITEFQHRLEAIVITGVEPTIPYVLGVSKDSFTNTATAKPRRPVDEIQRKYKDAQDSEVTILKELLLRKQGEKLTMQNAISKWDEYKSFIIKGHKLIDSFFDATEDYSSFKRTFGAWATLMIVDKKEKEAKLFLDLLEKEICDGETSFALTKDFYELSQKTWNMSNTGRPEYMYYLLCVASDRIIKNNKGQTTIALTTDKFNHNYFKQKGVYRKFLVKEACA
tara:strand:- start:86 stop:994 length:909 start_codon:yes stop_codon:yes gene_type:complete